ncbi:uncharacterized protein LOC111459328 [Cucurbita moschata]|uniref:Uncharacterized protein LOC111459328 n=1 Tax=Cucurbita moschata TaxID=3662 RepID=A0A6J1H1Q4_CUCMO|nr:uncharacterized protein LOC111459328 [Cucurbita moschata]XP_022957945.1 uncharacterized protein LOC111459328 [Cucurbita moschata]XP_022957946.1 uncharacterized protein LOC111459328 [Cucurbita moschata]XP_022957947.1 uncharacterized protein LOC111459328 [Cucurbita moschata]XP_022957948.1 uncharacterized protein LOC111459328 [Cucurbita moschata]
MAGALKSFSPIAMINVDTELLVQLPQNDCNSRVLVLGSTGRVGTSIAIALFKFSSLAVATGAACCETEKGAAMVATVGRNSRFVEVDAENVKSLEAALRDVDPVVHTAGSFQQTEKCTVLEASINIQPTLVLVMIQTIHGMQKLSRIKLWRQIFQLLQLHLSWSEQCNGGRASTCWRDESRGDPDRLKRSP